MDNSQHIPLSRHFEFSEDVMQQRAARFYEEMQLRRTIRDFSTRPVPRKTIEECLRTAGTAPSGANMQPWNFVVVSDPAVKSQIRQAAEENERVLYEKRASAEWLDALSPLGTNAHKPFLEEAPYLIAVFAQPYGLTSEGKKVKHYYVQESVGLATGILITALHHAGLTCLTYTPSPMKFLSSILHRPDNERPFLLLVTGYPSTNATIPVLEKKSLPEFATFI